MLVFDNNIGIIVVGIFRHKCFWQYIPTMSAVGSE